jgi:hypothetical protein
MRITLNLPDRLLAELTAVTGEKNKTLLIRNALEEARRKALRSRAISLGGKIDLDIDLDEQRKRDLL